MHSFLDSKTMAKTLRQTLAQRKIALSHSECLEIVARQFGLGDWNTLAASIDAARSGGTPLAAAAGWFATGYTDPRKYRLGLDPSSPGTALIECLHDRKTGIDSPSSMFACMMQSIVADGYRGRTIELTASLRATDADLGTIWMRIDKAPGAILRFDNMMDRRSDGPVEATTDWTQRNIVLDVPNESTSIHYGFFLKGYGRVRARDFRLTAVAEDRATTDVPPVREHRHPLAPQPINLDFSLSGSATA